jgi:flavodoxin
MFMKALVVYDSTYGNTRKIAEAVAAELGRGAKAICISDVRDADLSGLDLLVAGSPVLGWSPSEKTRSFLVNLKPGQLKGVKAAAFDTRMRIIIHGDAAKKMAAFLQKAGAEMVGEPAGFIVEGREGPLAKDALAKARDWAASLNKN